MNQDTPFLKFNISHNPKKIYDLPAKLTEITKINQSKVDNTREFVFQGMGPTVNINGKQMDMDRIDEAVQFHDTEIWEISNASGGMMNGMGGMGKMSSMGMAHPFHAHGVQFQILERNGNPPPSNETGWKDTILVRPGEKVRAIATFNQKGIFMYHCHILEHEDAGMMGQFEVK